MYPVRFYFLLLSFVFFVTGCLEIGYHDLTEDENDNSNKTDKPTTNIGRDSEQTLSDCSDGMDNDDNGYIDCADYSCFKLSSGATEEARRYCCKQKSPHWTENVTENTFITCSDGLDNDCDGFIDCEDRDCANATDPQIYAYCNPPATDCPIAMHYCEKENETQCCSDMLYICVDHIWMLGENCPALYTNGYCDIFLGKSACAWPCSKNDVGSKFYYDQVCNTENIFGIYKCELSDQHQYGFWKKYRAKSYCSYDENDNASILSCNGNNELIQTTCPHACLFKTKTEDSDDSEAYCSAENCTDGIDNDGNGYTDCEDFGCFITARGATLESRNYCCQKKMPGWHEGDTETTLSDCSDGLDNDCNGYVDCDDNACNNSVNSQIHAYCHP